MSTFTRDLHRRVQAGYQAFALPTRELRRALAELAGYGRAHATPVVAWDAVNGLHACFPADAAEAKAHGLEAEHRLIAAIARDEKRNCRGNAAGALDLAASAELTDRSGGRALEFPARALFVLVDFHNQFAAAHPLRTRFSHYHAAGQFSFGDDATGHVHPLVMLTPSPGLHPDVDHLLEPLSLRLMSPAEIRRDVVEYVRASLPEGKTGLEGPGGEALAGELAAACTGLLSHQVVDVLSLAAGVGDEDELAASGLDRAEARRRKRVGFHPCSVKIVRDHRRDLINASGLAKVHEGRERFADVAGLGALKTYLAGLLRRREGPAVARPKGVLVVGVPGCGKSMMAKAVGNESGRQTLTADLGSLMGSALGETENNVQRLLELVDSAGPSVLLLDEVEKMFAGSESSGKTDGGTISRAIGKVLTWSADRGPESGAFLFATANSLDSLPSAFYRSGRFNAIFFAGAPSAGARADMWAMYKARYGLEPGQPTPPDEGWTGAEIANCCEQAYLLGVPLAEAESFVTRTMQVNRAEMDALEETAAKAGFLDAELGGPYVKGRRAERARPRPAAAPRARRIADDPSVN